MWKRRVRASRTPNSQYLILSLTKATSKRPIIATFVKAFANLESKRCIIWSKCRKAIEAYEFNVILLTIYIYIYIYICVCVCWSGFVLFVLLSPIPSCIWLCKFVIYMVHYHDMKIVLFRKSRTQVENHLKSMWHQSGKRAKLNTCTCSTL